MEKKEWWKNTEWWNSPEEQEEYNIWFDEMLAKVRLHPREGYHFNMINEGNALIIKEVVYEK